MIKLKQVDLSKIVFQETPECKNFCTHPDIDTSKQYLAKIDGTWYVVRFAEVWFGLTSWVGYMWQQLSYHEHGVWRSHFEELYELP